MISDSLAFILIHSTYKFPIALFAAKYVKKSSYGVVKEFGFSDLFELNINTLKYHRILHLNNDLRYPILLNPKRLVFLSVDSVAHSNILVTLDRLSNLVKYSVRLPAGNIERLVASVNHQYLFAHYKPNDTSKQEAASRTIVVIKGTEVIMRLDDAFDVDVDPLGKYLMAIVGNSHELLTYNLVNRERTSLPIKIRTDTVNICSGLGELLCMSVSENKELHIGKCYTKLVTPITKRFGFDEFSRFLPDFQFEPRFSTELVFDARLKQFVIIGMYWMSDGAHHASLRVSQSRSWLAALCLGRFLFRTSRNEVVSLDTAWVGKYKDGGQRIGRIRVQRGTRHSFCTPESLNILDCSLTGQGK